MTDIQWRAAGWSEDPDVDGGLGKPVSVALKNLCEAKDPKKVLEKWDALTKEVANLGKWNTNIPSKPISDFFVTVGRGVVEAQQVLDYESAQYNQQNPAMKTLFRVPKASAEINFAISSVAKDGWNVLVYGESREQSERNEQKVKFDVVAVPPPLEMMAGVVTPLMAKGLRASLRERLQAYAKANSLVETDPYVADFDSVLIFRAAEPRSQQDTPRDYWVMLRAYVANNNYNLDVVCMPLEPQPGETGILLSMGKADAAVQPRFQALARLLFGLGSEQKAQLKS